MNTQVRTIAPFVTGAVAEAAEYQPCLGWVLRVRAEQHSDNRAIRHEAQRIADAYQGQCDCVGFYDDNIQWADVEVSR